MKEKSNPVIEWWNNLKNTKKNIKRVQSSPYARLIFAQKVRKMILIPLIIFLIWRGYDMIVNYHASGFMNTFGKLVLLLVFAVLIWKIWATIPAAKKQIEYYRKYPHVINYCPTNVKEDVDDIIAKIKSNQEEKKNVQKKQESNKKRSSRASKTPRD